MSIELARKWIPGRGWVYVAEEEPSGGGGPDVSWQRAEYSGSTLEIEDGLETESYLPWDILGFGEPLLDITVPDTPLMVASGVYAINAIVALIDGTPAVGGYIAVLHLDAHNEDAIAQASAVGPKVASQILMNLACTYYVPAGGAVRLGVYNADGANDHTFRLTEAAIQRLS